VSTIAKHVLRSAVITVNGTDLSDHCSSVTLEDSAEEVDFTSFGASAYREFGQGMKDATITATFFNDYASSSVDAVLSAAYAGGTPFPVTVKASSAATSATNPIFTLSAQLYNYNPIAGAVGDANTTDVTFRNAGTAGLTRGTA
jgi:hypothetical protein